MESRFIVAFVLLALNSVAHGFVCPSDGLFLNPDDQHTYFQCAFGKAHLMPCPAGLVWDQSNPGCEWPAVQGMSIWFSYIYQRSFFSKLKQSHFLHKGDLF